MKLKKKKAKVPDMDSKAYYGTSFVCCDQSWCHTILKNEQEH